MEEIYLKYTIASGKTDWKWYRNACMQNV